MTHTIKEGLWFPYKDSPSPNPHCINISNICVMHKRDYCSTKIIVTYRFKGLLNQFQLKSFLPNYDPFPWLATIHFAEANNRTNDWQRVRVYDSL